VLLIFKNQDGGRPMPGHIRHIIVTSCVCRDVLYTQ